MRHQANDIWLFIENSYLDDRFIYFTIYPILLSGFIVMLFSLPYLLMDLSDWSITRKYRIDKDRVFDFDLIKRSLKLFSFNWAVQLFLAVLLWPLISLSSIQMDLFPDWEIIIIQLIGCLFLDDLLFYIFHKILHKPWFYKRVHSVHHEITKPYAMAAGHFHILEYLILSLSFLVGPILLGVHIYVFYIWIVVRQWIAVEGHCGYDFPFSIQKFIPMHDGNSYHDAHHRNQNCNFGLYLNWLDRITGAWEKKQ